MVPWQAWRIRKNMSQQTLADAVALSRAALSHIENGTRNPSLDVLQKLCEKLELTDKERLEAAGLTRRKTAGVSGRQVAAA